jgi:hypothetical protein
VDAALQHTTNPSLQAEVQHWRGMQECFQVLNGWMKKLEDEVYKLGIEQKACKDRFKAANLMDRILSEMGHNQRIICQVRAECGRSAWKGDGVTVRSYSHLNHRFHAPHIRMIVYVAHYLFFLSIYHSVLGQEWDFLICIVISITTHQH